MASPKQFYILSTLGYTKEEIANMDEQTAWDTISGSGNYSLSDSSIFEVKHKKWDKSKFLYMGADGKVKGTTDKNEALDNIQNGQKVSEKAMKEYIDKFKLDFVSEEPTKIIRDTDEYRKKKESDKYETERNAQRKEMEYREDLTKESDTSALKKYVNSKDNLSYDFYGGDYNNTVKGLLNFLNKEFNADIYHSSGKSKYSSSVYFNIGDNSYRISDHKLPEIGHRTDDFYAPAWKSELVLNNDRKYMDIFKLKTDEDLKKYLIKELGIEDE